MTTNVSIADLASLAERLERAERALELLQHDTRQCSAVCRARADRAKADMFAQHARVAAMTDATERAAAIDALTRADLFFSELPAERCAAIIAEATSVAQQDRWINYVSARHVRTAIRLHVNVMPARVEVRATQTLAQRVLKLGKAEVGALVAAGVDDNRPLRDESGVYERSRPIAYYERDELGRGETWTTTRELHDLWCRLDPDFATSVAVVRELTEAESREVQRREDAGIGNEGALRKLKRRAIGGGES